MTRGLNGPLFFYRICKLSIVESGFVLLAAGAALRYLWQGISQGFTYIKTKTTYCIQCNNDNSIYWHVEEWIDQTPYIKRCKNIAIKNYWDRTIKTLGYGLHTFKHNGVRFIVYKHKEESKDSNFVRENLTVVLLTRRLEFLEGWLKEINDAHDNTPYKCTKVYISKKGNDLSVEKPISGREPTLENNAYESLIDDIMAFISKEKEYTRLGIPYKRGYLLYGPPGNGKTTTILCIAQRLKKHIKMVNLAELSNTDLISVVGALDKNSILVLEDIDCVSASNKRDESTETGSKEAAPVREKVTLNVLLNCLDGLLTKHGQITFATTNHIDKLDPALIRDGRMDRKVKFNNATAQQAKEYHLKFFNDEALAEEFASKYNGRPMCELEQAVLERFNNEQA